MTTTRTLQELKRTYLNIRENGLATRIVINTELNDHEITNKQVINSVLDLLIHEAGERLKEELQE